MLNEQYDNRFVFCIHCQQDHTPGEVDALDIEEDAVGRDVMTFLCHKHPQDRQRSLIFRKM